MHGVLILVENRGDSGGGGGGGSGGFFNEY